VLQAMDAAGKDGAIKHVMSGINPQGCRVTSFKRPSETELAHDFLWRTNRELPARGQIGIFNLSYYEEVLVGRVHPELLQGQRLPSELVTKKIWKERLRSIRDLEAHLHRSGTKVVKLFLHVSQEEQRRRLLARIDDPRKHWKFDVHDLDEREHWNAYMQAYEQCLAATSTEESPWYVVPADDKNNARLIISHLLNDALRSLHMQWPSVGIEREKELQEVRSRLAG
jgi:PPK2 family polyphosphate:nucleotide phosphotransferase